jgi:Type II secretion system protein B
VEVIVYSDDRPQRWAFISGRKYVEGDAIGAGARVEEIQSTGVVLVEDGRRITLRP